MSVHDASRAAANKMPSERTERDWAAINTQDQQTRNNDAEARKREKIYGPKK